MYLLSKVVQQIIEGAAQLYDENYYDAEFMYQKLCFCPRNDQLNDYSTYHQSSQSFTTSRQQILTGNEQVAGDFLLLDYCGHMPELRLVAFTSRQQLEDSILNEGGIFNSFTTMLIPIIFGQFQPYRVAYQAQAEPEQQFLPNDFYQQRVAIEITDEKFATSQRTVIWGCLDTD